MFVAISVAKKHENKAACLFRFTRLSGTSEYESLVDIAIKPNVHNSQECVTTNKNQKQKKTNNQIRKNWNLEIIPEEESTFKKEFEMEHQEALEAISVAKEPKDNHQIANCFISLLSTQPSTSYAAASMTP